MKHEKSAVVVSRREGRIAQDAKTGGRSGRRGGRGQLPAPMARPKMAELSRVTGSILHPCARDDVKSFSLRPPTFQSC